MLLAVDIGNTSITLGVFDNDELIDISRVPSDINISAEDYKNLLKQNLKNFCVTDCIIVSVVDGLESVLENVVSSLYSIQPIVLDAKLLGEPNNCHSEFILESNQHSHTVKMLKQVQHDKYVIDFSKFSTLGADRIANVAAGVDLYPLPLIIVDFGTANTFDIINKNGEYVGGLIAPGVGTQLKSLNLMTSKLPLLEVEDSPSAIATTTKDAMLSGVIRGTASMISGMIEESEKELGQKATIIATGGLANVVANYMKRKFDDINLSLTLQGAKEIYKRQQTLLRL